MLGWLGGHGFKTCATDNGWKTVVIFVQYIHLKTFRRKDGKR